MSVFVSDGILIGSSLDAGVHDLLVAADSAGVTNATFQGEYVGGVQVVAPAGDKALFLESPISPITADGKGNVSIVAKDANSKDVVVSGTSNISNGLGTLLYPGADTQEFFVSRSGDLLVGGLAYPPDYDPPKGPPGNGDFFVAVRKSSNPAPVQGLYYLVQQDYTANVYGSFQTTAKGRLYQTRYQTFFDPRVSDGSGLNTGRFPSKEYVSPTGSLVVRVEETNLGNNTIFDYGISLSIRAPDLSGTGVYLNPMGVVNAAGYMG
ncbi:MAG: hypothetical protein ABI824_18595 [Acidobacteriota bacterium]